MPESTMVVIHLPWPGNFMVSDQTGKTREPVLPDFLIVGAMKAGTSSLTSYLRHHPQVYAPFPELNFFSHEENWARGVEWYSRCFHRYGGEKCVGEKSPSYSDPKRLTSRHRIPGRICSVVPEVKLIWCLRNPVDRAYSHYWHMANKAKERRSFDEAVKAAPGAGISPASRYVQSSVYVSQIERYMEVFPRGQMLFVVSENLFERPAATLRQVHSFLGVDVDVDLGEHIQEIKASRRYLPRPFRLQGYVYRLIEKRDRKLAKKFQRAIFNVASFERPPMQPDTRRELEAFFAPHNRELSDLLGIDVRRRWQSDLPANRFDTM